jgi:hypothetical protein
LDILLSFLVGFVGVWLFFRFSIIQPNQCNHKESIVDVAKVYGSNKKICKELKRYSLHQIKKGNYEYVEVIDIIKKRQLNDKIRA